jgi:hypothetical protein
MAKKMISHMAKELLTEQILADSFEIFKDMGLYFDDEQLDASKLIELVLSLTFFCFTNWGIALFYKNYNPDDNSEE